MVQSDFLIVGQGLAGSILAYKLIQGGKSVYIVDEESGNTASRQATGLINPITGRRFVKSWMIDQLLPAARKFYTSLSKDLGSPFYQETQVLKIIQSHEQLNDFHSRLADENYSDYLFKHADQMSESINHGCGQALIKSVLQLDINTLLNSLEQYFVSRKIIRNEAFDFKVLNQTKNGFEYKNHFASKIIFAEGFKVRNNPYFKNLPNRFAKGEALIIKSEALKLNQILNSKVTISPLGQDNYYVGATYDWRDMEQKPTAAKKQYLLEGLERSIHVPYEVVKHKVGIRPTVVDRRPLLGRHRNHENMYIFNGMGSKGLSLAPYFADELIQFIELGKELNKEVEIKRFHHD